METKQAVLALSALAQDTRLGIFRLLVQAGPQGMAAGQIGEKLDLAPATLSFHLAGLHRAGLAQSRHEGRFVIYSADFQAMNALVGFLSENCCGGRECQPTTGEQNETPTRTRRRA
ncbi:MAG: metalloregulator ArsR/SmtB family transcription factor [Betaproteobacteria bacterium]|nr:metalloregulator ArsR/SmtB family transcription factor [Betaproteobacteria bacterium]MDH4325285.1 metalloregulator ArsR/SmtB family transcription factor [Betaproteobacteria bacterium]MDH5212546.1 metalloregulator ArsR/SmtB family transcription factor [Betaproteobacteria bacterium]MDH5579279.1 metalloregulator ArsR/SmtB family transcription factor [Betaproteobacteria bacterium]